VSNPDRELDNGSGVRSFVRLASQWGAAPYRVNCRRCSIQIANQTSPQKGSPRNSKGTSDCGKGPVPDCSRSNPSAADRLDRPLREWCNLLGYQQLETAEIGVSSATQRQVDLGAWRTEIGCINIFTDYWIGRESRRTEFGLHVRGGPSAQLVTFTAAMQSIRPS